MPNTNLFDQVQELKGKFKEFFLHKKKLQALENYSFVADFQHKDYLSLIKRCMADGFLGEREADFLCYMLEKYELNFLEWSHKTQWLKGEMRRLALHYEKPVAAQLPLFDFQTLRPNMASHVPFELLAQHQKQQMQRNA